MKLLPPDRPLYHWNGEIADDCDVLAMAKTTTARFEAVRELICAHHVYDCPKVIGLPIETRQAPFLDWIT